MSTRCGTDTRFAMSFGNALRARSSRYSGDVLIRDAAPLGGGHDLVASLIFAWFLILISPLSSGLAINSGSSAIVKSSHVLVFDLSGNKIEPLSEPKAKAVALIFTRTDCPISNRYAPVLRDLNHRFTQRGVSFWLVYVDPHQEVEDVRQNIKDYGYDLHVALDPQHTLVKIAGVVVTPEVAVFSPQAQLLYRGRIDNQYVDFGKALPAPTRHDLELTLDAILSDRPVPRKTTPAVGCYISDLE